MRAMSEVGLKHPEGELEAEDGPLQPQEEANTAEVGGEDEDVQIPEGPIKIAEGENGPYGAEGDPGAPEGDAAAEEGCARAPGGPEAPARRL